MYAVLVGLLLLLLKWQEIGPVATWSWWWVLSPFAVAAAWWTWADQTGYYKRREMRKLEEKQHARRLRSLDALGMTPKGRHDR